MKHVAMAVVVRNGKILIQRRFRHAEGMVYEFPGGAIDAGESPEQAARRELFEETGLPCGPLLGTHRDTNQWGGDIHYVVLLAPEEGEPVATNPLRQQTFDWFTPQNIPLSDFYPVDIAFIQTRLDCFIQGSEKRTP